MKNNKTKKLILDNLRKVPIIEVACSKSGIARSTLYRWRDKNKKFRKELEEALIEGEELINDMSESQVITLIKEKNWQAISFWLKHRNPRFRERVEVTARVENQEELTPEQKIAVKKALGLASLAYPKKLTLNKQNNEKANKKTDS